MFLGGSSEPVQDIPALAAWLKFTMNVRNLEKSGLFTNGRNQAAASLEQRGNQAGKCFGAQGRESDPLSSYQPHPILHSCMEGGALGASGQQVHSPLCSSNTYVKTPKGISCKFEFLMRKEMFPDIKKKITSSNIIQKKRKYLGLRHWRAVKQEIEFWLHQIWMPML